MYSKSSRARNTLDQINYALHIKNFGPVSDAKITLKPLTVFVGPNNSGKSYTAMLIHSIISAHHDNLWHPHYGRMLVPPDSFQMLEQLETKIKKAETANPIVLDSEINDIAKKLIKNIEKKIPQQIRRNFNSDLKNIVRINSLEFKINTPGHKISVTYKDGSCHISYPDLTLKSKAMIQKRKHRIIEHIDINGDVTYDIPASMRHYASFDLVEHLYAFADSKIRGRIPRQSYYLPAARSGILQGHSAITASVIRGAPYAGIEGAQIPPLSGVAADFISSIITMPKRNGYFYKYVEDLDSNILDGHITISRDKHRLPEIKYKFMNHDIPLHRTSSTVSEMAPFILYLRHIVDKDSLLIVEEPEAHLHPKNQLILARYIARLVRAGLNILITTHSHFILEQLSILLQASVVNSETKETMNLKADEYLNEDEVAPYLFSRINSGNHTVEPIECTATEGISQEDFVRIQEELYEQTIRVEQNIP